MFLIASRLSSITGFPYVILRKARSIAYRLLRGRTMKHIVAFAFTLLLAGCAGSGASNLNLVSLGMNKIQVQDILGNPDTTSAQAPYEYFMYSLSDDFTANDVGKCAVGAVLTLGVGAFLCGNEEDYFVRFENGVVESYGRVGDFDSTQVPEATINVNRN